MRILDFSDGFVSTEEPTAGSFSPSNKLMTFSSDANFITYKDSAAASGDIYFNSTLQKPRIYDGDEWVTLSVLDASNDLSLAGSSLTAEQILSTDAAKKVVSTGVSTADFLKIIPQVIGSIASAIEITASNGIDPVTFLSPKQFDRYENTIFIKGESGGTIVTANPQIKVGSFVGQKLHLIGTSDTLTVLLDDGDGINTGGQMIIFKLGTIVSFFWTGTDWTILSHNGLI